MTYWEDRFALLEQAQNKTGMDTYRDIEKVLNKTQKEIDKEIEKWIYRISVNNEVSMTEARKLLNSKELKEFKWDVKQYIKYGQENAINQQWLKELENASAKFHISRLEALKIQTQQALEVAYGNQLDSIDGMMRKVYTENYYHTAYEIQKGLHVGFDVGKINENKLNKVLNKPWTTDGKTFSDRIWTKKNQMVGELHQQITRQVIQGKSPDIAIKEMQKYVDSSVKNAKYTASRLVMTEQAFIASASTKDSYHDLDVEFYEILATLDSRTSDVCQNMDGKVFPMKDYSIGATAPPFHVFCRTTTIPHFDDNYGGERIARDEDGQTYYVPDRMKYSDWKECFVDHTKDPSDLLKPIEDVANALLRYISSESYIINDKLRNNLKLTKQEEKFISELDAELNKFPNYTGNLIRTIDFSDFPNVNERVEYFVNQFIEGEIIEFKEYISTSKMVDYNDNAQIKLYITDAKNGKDISSINVEEQEVLYKRNSKFEVMSKIKQDGVYYILLGEVQ
jgi:SPP1 gp7 family putative phage head morphogenesis protein